MRRLLGRTGWASVATFFSAALMAAGLSMTAAPAQAAFELPEGEKITNLPAIPRAMPQKEAYELYDPKIGKNFDLKNFWLRADLRVRPEYRNAVCFGGNINTTGNCNSAGTAANVAAGKAANDFFVQQWVRLGIGYDLSPDVNFYMEIIDSATWGGNGSQVNAGNGGDPLNHNGTSTGANINGNGGTLGVRAAYMLIRNFAGVQGLSLKAGRQYVIFGNHSLFGHFDWANTGYSHDGVMLQYSTKAWDSYYGWFHDSETDISQAAPVGSGNPNIVGTGQAQNAMGDSDWFIFYNQIKSIPGFLIEPYYVYYKNNLGAADFSAQGLGTAKHSDQTRHMVGNRIEMRKGNFDFTDEIAYQFGQMGNAGAAAVNNPCGTGSQSKCLHINAWATRNWIGYTHYQSAWKPRIAFNFDYASGDGRANCTLNGAYGLCKTANTFENFYPTNHIHMGYMDVQAWKNMLSPSANFQARPSKDDHIEIWYTNLNLANKKDNWYRGSQGVYVFSQANNTKSHIGDEVDFTWTHMFMDGKVAFQATYSYLFLGGYVQQNLGTSRNQEWAYAQLWINF
ncbi:MAG TPA: alginate export family protein [Nitrospira sp.]|nr:alginate export family protein [Nitrospira sp.]